jgi:hypothetical protein
MSKLTSAASAQGHEAVHNLFEAGGPVLIEVRVPGGFFSPDWHLCETVDDFDRLLDQLDADAVLHVSRVSDLSNRAGPVVLRR